MTPETAMKRGRPAQQTIAPGKRGEMKDGIRRYLSRDGKTVRYQIKVSAADPATGKVRASWQTFTSKADAEKARDAQRHDRGAGRFVFPDKLTVGDWMTAFLAARAAGTRATTQESYSTRAAHITAHLGGTKLQALTSESIQAFERALSAKLAPSTRRGVLRLLKSALSLAVARGRIKVHPFGTRESSAVVMPKINEGETTHALSAEDISTILRIFADSELWLRVVVLAYTGLRRGELCALRWRSIDFDKETLHVGGTVWHTKAGLAIEAPKVERSRRTIPIDPMLAQELRQHKARQAETGLALGLAQSDDWLIFPATPDRPTVPERPKNFCQKFTAKLKPTRFADVTPHVLRHAHGSILLGEGVSLPAVAARLGHSPTMCARVYAHEIEGHDRAAAVKFGASVARSGSGLPGAVVPASTEEAKPLTRIAI